MSASPPSQSAPVALCAVADDPYAADVVATGTWLATALGFETHFVYVKPARSRPDRAGMHLTTEHGPDPAALFADLRIPAEQASVVVDDAPQDGIARAVADRGAQVVVMGSRGQGAVLSAALGSVARAVVAKRQVPVVVVRAGSTPLTFGGPVVCGVAGDGEVHAAVAQAAGRMASRLDVSIVLVHAVESGTVRTGSPRLPGPAAESDRRDAERILSRAAAGLPAQLETNLRIRKGRPAAALESVADEFIADLVVVGHRARGALATAVTGSTALELIGKGRRTTMLLPPQVAPGFLSTR